MNILEKQLPIPEVTKSDPKSFKFLRAWVANGAQHIVIRGQMWEDPAAWGIMLADLARLVVNTYEAVSPADKDLTLKRIRRGFDVELNSSD